MSQVYCCPNCRTNKSRFNLIQQVATPIKKDPRSGEIVAQYSNDTIEPFHLAYNGPDVRVQCAACGLIEDEKTFAAFGERSQ
ncbi:DNA alkylation repair protein [Bacillus sp. JJ634]